MFSKITALCLLFSAMCCLLFFAPTATHAYIDSNSNRHRHNNKQRHRSQVNPAYHTSISQSALQYMSKQAIPAIVSQVMNTPLPDISQEVHTPIGDVQFDLTNLKINSFSIAALDVAIVPDVGVQVGASNIVISVNGDWKYEKKSFPRLSDSGTLDMDADMTIRLVIRISADTATGKLSLSVAPDADVQLDNLQIKLHGGASWLYNTFISAFKKTLSETVRNAMIDMINGELNQRLIEESAAIDYVVPVGPVELGLVADFSVLVASCQTTETDGTVAIGARGEILFNKTGALPYPGAVAPPVTLRQTEMIEIVLVDFLFNTAAWAAYQSQVMQVLITNAMIPPTVPIKLNTAMFKTAIPGLYQKYPDMEMQVLISDMGNNFETAPKVTISSANGLMISTVIRMEWGVVLDESQVVPVFVLNSTLIVEGKASISSDNRITAAVQLDDLIVGVERSIVGEIDLKSLSTFIKSMIQYVAMPLVNKILETGFQIPTFEGIQLQNPKLTFQDRHLSISSDFTYTPAPELPVPNKKRYHL